MPFMTIAGLLDAQEAYRRATAAVAGRSGSMLLDLGDVVPPNRACFLDSSHYTSLGAAYFGRAFSQALAGTQGFRDALPRTLRSDPNACIPGNVLGADH